MTRQALRCIAHSQPGCPVCHAESALFYSPTGAIVDADDVVIVPRRRTAPVAREAGAWWPPGLLEVAIALSVLGALAGVVVAVVRVFR